MGFEDVEPVKDINKYCKQVGLILIGLGILHIILSEFLDAYWGVLIIVIGVIALLYRRRSIILVVGIALIVVGLLNILGSYDVNVFWSIFGILQIVWGIQELRRYGKTKENKKYAKKKDLKRNIGTGFR